MKAVAVSTLLAALLTGPHLSLAESSHAGPEGDDAMARARAEMFHHMGGQTFTLVSADRLEWIDDAGGMLLWDLDVWHGGDIHKLWLKTEGERGLSGAGTEEAELQALYSRAITPFFDLQGGVRRSIRPGPARTHAVLGLHGLAPYWLEVDVAAFLSERGDLTARAEIEYDLMLSQRWVLQPRIEVEAAAQRVSDQGLGRGLTSVEAGLRLRYEVRRSFAPYVGVTWHRTLGGSRDLARAAGEELEATALVAGVRIWF